MFCHFFFSYCCVYVDCVFILSQVCLVSKASGIKIFYERKIRKKKNKRNLNKLLNFDLMSRCLFDFIPFSIHTYTNTPTLCRFLSIFVLWAPSDSIRLAFCIEIWQTTITALHFYRIVQMSGSNDTGLHVMASRQWRILYAMYIVDLVRCVFLAWFLVTIFRFTFRISFWVKKFHFILSSEQIWIYYICLESRLINVIRINIFHFTRFDCSIWLERHFPIY